MDWIKKLVIYGLIITFASCSSSQNSVKGNRNPANEVGTSCQQLATALLSGRALPTSLNQSLYKNSMEKLASLQLTSTQEIKSLLKDPYYKKYVFQNENVEDLNTSALIIDLLRKSHPQSSSEQIVKKYHKLFHTCGI